MAKIKSKTKCLICSKEVTNNNLLRHTNACLNIKNIVRKGAGHQKGIPAWNKGLTKETSMVLLELSKKQSIRRKEEFRLGQRKTHIPTDEERQRTSERMSLYNPGGKCKWYEVAGKKVQGSYEKQFAECLEEAKICWEKIKTNNHLFKYKSNGKIKSYAPDFYLSEFNLYVEIKGFWWGNDEHKMQQIKEQHLDKRVIIVFGKEKLNHICSDVKKYLPLVPVWSW